MLSVLRTIGLDYDFDDGRRFHEGKRGAHHCAHSMIVDRRPGCPL